MAETQELLLRGQVPVGVRHLGLLLGSFDPLHLGHQWMARELLGGAGCDAVLMLVPAQHFHKEPRPFPRSAPRWLRVALIQRALGGSGRVIAGLTREVLFLRLVRHLEQRSPGVQVHVGLGQDSFRQLQRSEHYFARLHLPWRTTEQRQLERLSQRCLVFERGQQASGGPRTAPGQLRWLCSTRVRQLALELHAQRASPERWQRRLGRLVAPPVLHTIRGLGLYGDPRPQRSGTAAVRQSDRVEAMEVSHGAR